MPPSPGNSLLFSVNSLGILLKDVYPLLSLLDLEMVCTFFTYASVSYYSVVWSHLPACDVWKCGIAMCTIIRNSFFFNVWITSSPCHHQWRNFSKLPLWILIFLQLLFSHIGVIDNIYFVSLTAFTLTRHLEVRQILLSIKVKAFKLEDVYSLKNKWVTKYNLHFFG